MTIVLLKIGQGCESRRARMTFPTCIAIQPIEPSLQNHRSARLRCLSKGGIAIDGIEPTNLSPGFRRPDPIDTFTASRQFSKLACTHTSSRAGRDWILAVAGSHGAIGGAPRALVHVRPLRARVSAISARRCFNGGAHCSGRRFRRDAERDPARIGGCMIARVHMRRLTMTAGRLAVERSNRILMAWRDFSLCCGLLVARSQARPQPTHCASRARPGGSRAGTRIDRISIALIESPAIREPDRRTMRPSRTFRRLQGSGRSDGIRRASRSDDRQRENHRGRH
jgi:hypothetical protein